MCVGMYICVWVLEEARCVEFSGTGVNRWLTGCVYWKQNASPLQEQ